MAKAQTILQVFVASPSDVVDERKILEDVINEFNLTWGDAHEVRLELLKWETHSRPGFGDDAQDVINQQIGDEYDIFLGVMWGRFGTPTKRSESGTEEEFERAYARLASQPENVKIMFYFKDTAIPPSKLDPEQLGKVHAFKRKISSEYGGLYYEFETSDEFQTKTRIHLSKLVQDWLKTPPVATVSAKMLATPTPTTVTGNPLANLMALSNDEEEGLIELTEQAEDALKAVAGVLEKMTEALNDVGEKTLQRSDEVNNLMAGVTTPNIKASKRIFNNAANDLDVFVNRMSVEIPEFHKQHFVAMDAFGKIALISATDFEEDPNDIKVTLSGVQEYRAVILSSLNSLSNFRNSTAGLPRVTAVFSHARKRTVAVIDDLLVQFRSAARQSEDVEELLRGMLGLSDDTA